MLTGRHGSAINGEVAVTLPAVKDYRLRVYELIWSYSAAPASGLCSSAGLEGDQLAFVITAAGPGAIPLAPAYGQIGAPITFTLAAGGPGVTGTLDVIYKPRE